MDTFRTIYAFGLDISQHIHIFRLSFGLMCLTLIFGLIFSKFSSKKRLYFYSQILSLNNMTFVCRSENCFRQMSDRKKFCCYMVYGFAIPCLLTFFIYIFDSTEILASYLRPGVGVEVCFISSEIININFQSNNFNLIQ